MERKAKVFAVRNKQFDSQAIGGVRLVKGTRAQVEKFIRDEIEISEASAEEAHELAAAGVRIEIVEVVV